MPRRRLFTFATVLLGAPVLAAIPGGSLVVAILGISFLIFIHEWGHFTACRLTGTRTETFSIGFGPRLFGWEKDRDGKRRFTVGRRRLDPADHAMDFRVAAIPLGGYVKMAGEIPGEGEASTGRPPAPDEFPAKGAWARTFIISAGVIMNFITAVVFYCAAIGMGKQYRPPVVGDVAPGMPAWQAGLQPGDRMQEMGGNTIYTWLDLQMEVALADDDESSTVRVSRDGEDRRFEVRPHYDEDRGALVFGVRESIGLELGEEGNVFSIGPSERVTVAGVPVVGGMEAQRFLQRAVQTRGLPVRLVKPDGTTFELTARPLHEGEAPDRDLAKVGLAAWRRPDVEAVRGSAREHLRPGDRLVAALVDGERRALETPLDVEALWFAERLDGLVVLREETETTVDLDLASQAAVAAFLRDVALGGEAEARVSPLPAGHLFDLGAEGLYRLPAAPALEAGIRAGERIVQVGDHVVSTFLEATQRLAATPPGQPVELRLASDGDAERTVTIRPVALEPVGKLPVTIVPHREVWETDGLHEAFALGASRTWRETRNVFRTIGALIGGSLSFNKNIAGPITLVDVSQQLAEDDALRLLWFLAYVSVMLAVLNILPIPVLDGGHLMFILLEKIKGRPLEEETIFRFQKIGLLLLLVLMFFAFKNDFTRIFS